MTEKIIFIDDEHSSRVLYRGTLQDIYGEEYEVHSIEPSPTIAQMIRNLEKYEDTVSIVIDEKLKVGAQADYNGSQLVEAIRTYNSKLPLYILTGEISALTPPIGNVDYIIDKNRIEIDDYKNQLILLMRRHINSFNEISLHRSDRFDYLLKKSVEEELTKDEVEEYEKLDFVRIREHLATEPLTSSEELDRQQQLIEEINLKLEQIERE